MGFPETDRSPGATSWRRCARIEGTYIDIANRDTSSHFCGFVVVIDGDGKSRGRSCFVIVSNFSWVGQKDLPGGGAFFKVLASIGFWTLYLCTCGNFRKMPRLMWRCPPQRCGWWKFRVALALPSHVLLRDVTANSQRKSCRGSALQLGHFTHAAKASLPVPPGLVQVESSPPSLAEAIPRWCVQSAAHPDLFPCFLLLSAKTSSRQATTSMGIHIGNSATSVAPTAAGAAL